MPDNSHTTKTFQMENWFQIVSPCYNTYVSTVLRAAFADISVPLLPLDFFVGAQHDPEFFIFFFQIFCFNSKDSSIFDM